MGNKSGYCIPIIDSLKSDVQDGKRKFNVNNLRQKTFFDKIYSLEETHTVSPHLAIGDSALSLGIQVADYLCYVLRNQLAGKADFSNSIRLICKKAIRPRLGGAVIGHSIKPSPGAGEAALLTLLKEKLEPLLNQK